MGSQVTVQDVYNAMPDEKKKTLHFLIGAAVSDDPVDEKEHAIFEAAYQEFTELEKDVANYLFEMAIDIFRD